MAWRTRRVRSVDTTLWPASWVITTDTHMDAAYRRLNRPDPHPLTLTPSQWLGVVASAGDPVSLDELARSAAQLFAEEAALTVSAGYPAAAAAEIAKALRPDSGASETDLRVARMASVRPTDVTALLADPEEAGAGVAALVVARRSRRMNAARERATRRLESDRDSAVGRARTEAMRAQEESARRAETETEASALREDLKVERGKRDEDRILSRRRLILAVALTALAIFGLWLLASGFVWSAGLSVLSIIVLGVTAADWATHADVTWHRLAFAAVPQIGTVIEILARWRN